MAWSPQSPVRTSHGHNRSLSFDLSPSISKAVGAPIVATGPVTPERHGLLHSPRDYDLSEKVRAKKIVAEIAVTDRQPTEDDWNEVFLGPSARGYGE